MVRRPSTRGMRATRATGSSSTSGGEYGYVDNLVGSPGRHGPQPQHRGQFLVELACRRQVPVLVGGPLRPWLQRSWWATPTKLRANTPVYHEAREMPVNPRMLVRRQTRTSCRRAATCATAIKVMRAADTCVLASRSSSRSRPQFADIILPVCHPLGGQRRRGLGRAVLAEPVWRRQRRRSSARTRLLAWKPAGEADVRGRARRSASCREIIERMGYRPRRRLPEEQLRPVAWLLPRHARAE